MSSKRQDLAEIIAARGSKNHLKFAREIAAYLIETKQINQLESLLRDVRAKMEKEGHIEADILVAHDISPDILNEAKEIIRHSKTGAKNIILNTTKDPSVIGGIKVRLAHEQIDMSIRAKLDTFKRLTTEGVK